MLMVGNDELGPPVGKTARCPNCGKRHKVEYVIDQDTGRESHGLGFVKCGKLTFVVAIAGRKFRRWGVIT